MFTRPFPEAFILLRDFRQVNIRAINRYIDLLIFLYHFKIQSLPFGVLLYLFKSFWHVIWILCQSPNAIISLVSVLCSMPAKFVFFSRNKSLMPYILTIILGLFWCLKRILKRRLLLNFFQILLGNPSIKNNLRLLNFCCRLLISIYSVRTEW